MIIYREQRALHLQRVQRVAKALHEAAHGGGRLGLHLLRTLNEDDLNKYLSHVVAIGAARLINGTKMIARLAAEHIF